ncbi:MAG: PocR ligand-binding domain-containing protein [Pseudomonadota bacterium]
MPDTPTYEELKKRVSELERAESERQRADTSLEKRLLALTRPLDDAGSIAFEDLFNLSDIQRLQDEFASATGVASIITHTDGTPITRPSNFCRLCNDIIRKTEKGLANCYRSDALIGRLSPGGPIVQPCMSGGLWDAGAAISVGGKHIANWLIGQVRDDTQTDEKIHRYAREIEADEEIAIAAFHEVPAMSRDRFEKVARMLYTLANLLSATAYQNMQQARFIADRKQAEEALREREESLKAILSANPNPMVLYDSEGIPLYINPAFTDIFGWTWDELQARRIPFVPEDQKNRTMETIGDIYRTGLPSVFETRRYTKDGRTLDIIVNAAVFKGPDGSMAGMVVNFTDISERKALQAHYEQAQKMESIGTLAGGIAHDFNNLLMGIQGRTSLMAFDLEPDHPNVEHIHAIEEYVRSASDLTQRLLGFARGGKYEVKPIDINEVVLSSSTMFGRTRKQIRILIKLDASSPVVEADRGQIEQVLLNMYVNAGQAMPDGGELSLETKIIMLNDQYCKSHLVTPGHYVEISVTDTGIGMDEATRRRIFDPFFSTREKGRGTGLGLASAYGIVKNHGGMITVYSETGHGTTFNIYLPASDKLALREAPLADGLFKGSERILLVDDEELILDVGQAMLERLGYRVVVAKGGQQAVDAVKSEGNQINLIILDLIMPGMDGGRTFDRIREIQPGMPVILSSGYTINGQANEILHRGCKGFLKKPFSINELSRIIRKVLDAANR